MATFKEIASQGENILSCLNQGDVNFEGFQQYLQPILEKEEEDLKSAKFLSSYATVLTKCIKAAVPILSKSPHNDDILEIALLSLDTLYRIQFCIKLKNHMALQLYEQKLVLFQLENQNFRGALEQIQTLLRRLKVDSECRVDNLIVDEKQLHLIVFCIYNMIRCLIELNKVEKAYALSTTVIIPWLDQWWLHKTDSNADAISQMTNKVFILMYNHIFKLVQSNKQLNSLKLHTIAIELVCKHDVFSSAQLVGKINQSGILHANQPNNILISFYHTHYIQIVKPLLTKSMRNGLRNKENIKSSSNVKCDENENETDTKQDENLLLLILDFIYLQISVMKQGKDEHELINHIWDLFMLLSSEKGMNDTYLLVKGVIYFESCQLLIDRLDYRELWLEKCDGSSSSHNMITNDEDIALTYYFEALKCFQNLKNPDLIVSSGVRRNLVKSFGSIKIALRKQRTRMISWLQHSIEYTVLLINVSKDDPLSLLKHGIDYRSMLLNVLLAQSTQDESCIQQCFNSLLDALRLVVSNLKTGQVENGRQKMISIATTSYNIGARLFNKRHTVYASTFIHISCNLSTELALSDRSDVSSNIKLHEKWKMLAQCYSKANDDLHALECWKQVIVWQHFTIGTVNPSDFCSFTDSHVALLSSKKDSREIETGQSLFASLLSLLQVDSKGGVSHEIAELVKKEILLYQKQSFSLLLGGKQQLETFDRLFQLQYDTAVELLYHFQAVEDELECTKIKLLLCQLFRLINHLRPGLLISSLDSSLFESNKHDPTEVAYYLNISLELLESTAERIADNGEPEFLAQHAIILFWLAVVHREKNCVEENQTDIDQVTLLNDVVAKWEQVVDLYCESDSLDFETALNYSQHLYALGDYLNMHAYSDHRIKCLLLVSKLKKASGESIGTTVIYSHIAYEYLKQCDALSKSFQKLAELHAKESVSNANSNPNTMLHLDWMITNTILKTNLNQYESFDEYESQVRDINSLYSLEKYPLLKATLQFEKSKIVDKNGRPTEAYNDAKSALSIRKKYANNFSSTNQNDANDFTNFVLHNCLSQEAENTSNNEWKIQFELAQSLQQIGELYIKRGNPRYAKHYFNLGLNLGNELKSTRIVSKFNLLLSSLAIQCNKTLEEFEEENSAFSQATNNSIEFVLYLLHNAEYLRHIHQYNQSIIVFNQIEKYLIEKMDDAESEENDFEDKCMQFKPLMEFYGFVLYKKSFVYQAMNDDVEALNCLETFMHYSDENVLYKSYAICGIAHLKLNLKLNQNEIKMLLLQRKSGQNMHIAEIKDSFLSSYELGYCHAQSEFIRSVCRGIALCSDNSIEVSYAINDSINVALKLEKLNLLKSIHDSESDYIISCQNKELEKLILNEFAVSDSADSNEGNLFSYNNIRKMIFSFHSRPMPIAAKFQRLALSTWFPSSWHVCSISLLPKSQYLMLVRECSYRPPAVVKLPLSSTQLISEFCEIISQSHSLISGNTKASTCSWKKSQKLKWWNSRQDLNSKLRNLLEAIETEWFHLWKVFLLPPFSNQEFRQKIDGFTQYTIKVLNSILKKLKIKNEVDESLVSIVVEGCDILSKQELVSVFTLLLDLEKEKMNEQIDIELQNLAEELYELVEYNNTQEKVNEDETVIVPKTMKVVQLRKELNARSLSTVGLKKVLIERLEGALLDEKRASPSKEDSSGVYHDREALVLVLSEQLHLLPFESMPCLEGIKVSRMPNISFIIERALEYNFSSSTHQHQQQNGELHQIDSSNARYFIDPRNDLPNTAAAFKSLVENQLEWDGFTGGMPKGELLQALVDMDLVLYCGHGTGEEYVSRDQLANASKCRATTLLMGCSSGRLKPQGNFEPSGMINSYMLSSCPAVVANLWDVTDKDIDKFTLKLLHEWLNIDGSTLDKRNLLDAIIVARKECKLEFLTGAAPVVYGMDIKVKH